MMPIALLLVLAELKALSWLVVEERVPTKPALVGAAGLHPAGDRQEEARGGRRRRRAARPGGRLPAAPAEPGQCVRIVYLNTTGVLGGAELLPARRAGGVRAGAAGLAARACCWASDGPLRAEVEALGVPCELVPIPGRLAGLGDAGLVVGGRKPGGRLALAAARARGRRGALGYVARLRGCLATAAPTWSRPTA